MKTRKSKINNKGITLVELMITIAISSLVFGVISMFILNSIKSYTRSNEEVVLQMEGQTILNQLTDLIMEAHNVKWDGTEKLAIYQGKTTYKIRFVYGEKRLYFRKAPTSTGTYGDEILFGEYVEDFQVIDTGVDNDNPQIKISFKLKKNNRNYEVKESVVTLRNKIK